MRKFAGFLDRLPRLSQWRGLWGLLAKKERRSLVVLSALFALSLIVLLSSSWLQATRVVPSRGGELIEGQVGSPRFINPLYADAQDVDRALVELVYSGLTEYGEDGEIAPDLAQRITVLNEGTTYIVDLTEDAFWHDGHPFGADDVVFTVRAIQDPAYKSPVRANWVGVNVRKLSEHRVSFTLKEPFAPFEERLTLPILPAHIWENISPENAALSSFNLQAVGTGPYKIREIERNKGGAVSELRLTPNLNYYGQVPFVQSLTLRFYATSEELAKAAQRGRVQSFVAESEKEAGARKVLSYSLPRYFALFFNLTDEAVEEQEVRQALSLALDKEALFGQNAVSSPLPRSLFAQQGASLHDPEAAAALLETAGYEKRDGVFAKTVAVSSGGVTARLGQGSSGAQVSTLQECLARDPEVYPDGIVNGVFGPLTRQGVVAFQEKYAQDVLAPSGLTSGTGVVGPSTRAKLDEVCFSSPPETQTLSLTISVLDHEGSRRVAAQIAQQLEAFGVEVSLLAFDRQTLEREVIKPREYQTLLFGQITGVVPDLFPYWHSGQAEDPGLNLSLYENDEADRLLVQARETLDEEERALLYLQFNEVLGADVPAVFLYDEPVLYAVPDVLKGLPADRSMLADPSKRFSQVEKWYITEKRVLK